jgi:hypothetical protein
MFQVQWINVESVYNVRWVFQPVNRETTVAGYLQRKTNLSAESNLTETQHPSYKDRLVSNV